MIRRVFVDDEQHRLRAAWRLVIYTIAMIVLAIAAALVLVLVGQLLGLEQNEEGGIQLPMWAASLTSVVATTLATWGGGNLLDRRRFADFGFHIDRKWWLDLGFGLALGAMLLAGIFGLELSLGWLEISERNVAPEGESFAAGLLGAMLLFLGVGFYEELMSRGYHLRNLAEGMSWPGRISPTVALLLGTLVSSAVFGVLHANNPSATAISTINVALAGCFLAVGLLLTGELAIPIGVHISWNFFQGNVFGFPVSGTDAGAKVFAIEQHGDPLWTGGEFGPEAGLLGIAAMLVGSAAIMGWARLTRGPLRVRTELALPPAERGEAVHQQG